MREEKLTELLSIHADSLLEGEDLVARPLAQTTTEDEVEELLQVARRAQATLAPIEPRAEFRAQLRAQLQHAAHNQAVKAQALRKRQVLFAAVGAGSMLVVGGAVVLLARFILRTAAALFSGGRSASV